MTLPFIPYARQSIRDADIIDVGEALKGDSITRGKKVEEFENAVKEYCGAKFAVAFNSGTTALMASYFAASLSPSDRVVSTTNSFIATVGQAIQMDNYPHLVDIERNTGNIDLERLSETLDFQSTRGKLIVVPVHFAGYAVDVRALDVKLRKHPHSMVIEDAAQAFGSSYPTGEKVGSCAWSQMTVFSFHPAKIMTTGEGGMVTTNDEDIYRKLRLYRNNGIVREAPHLEKESEYPGYYEVHDITGNFNFTDFQAALGLSQLSRMEKFIEKRRRLVKFYRKSLQEMAHIHLLTEEFDKNTAFHLFVVQIDFSAYQTTRKRVMGKTFPRRHRYAGSLYSHL